MTGRRTRFRHVMRLRQQEKATTFMGTEVLEKKQRMEEESRAEARLCKPKVCACSWVVPTAPASDRWGPFYGVALRLCSSWDLPAEFPLNVQSAAALPPEKSIVTGRSAQLARVFKGGPWEVADGRPYLKHSPPKQTSHHGWSEPRE